MGFDATYYTIQEPLWRKFLSHRNRVRQAVESLHSKYNTNSNYGNMHLAHR